MASTRIELEKLSNTRDLGGMSAADGKKIRKGKLIRSGHLYGAADRDLERLSKLLTAVVDFRSDAECSEKPDPTLPCVQYYHFPILEQQKAGVTRDTDSFEEVRRNMLGDADLARRYMKRIYGDFILSNYSVSQYRHFIDVLLEEHDGAVLWHCTAGKDRAGFASILVEELMGVSREEIRDDYMFTNVCLDNEIRSLIEMVRHQAGVDPEVGDEAIRYIFSAKSEYLDAIYEAVAEKYGDFDGYLRDGLHITDVEKAMLREMYLE